MVRKCVQPVVTCVFYCVMVESGEKWCWNTNFNCVGSYDVLRVVI